MSLPLSFHGWFKLPRTYIESFSDKASHNYTPQRTLKMQTPTPLGQLSLQTPCIAGFKGLLRDKR